MLNLSKEPQWSEIEEKQQIFCVQSSPDSQFMAAGLGNGVLTLRSPQTGRLSYSFVHSRGKFPVMSVRFLPSDPKHILSVSADGTIKEWNAKSSDAVWTGSEDGNEIFALDISCDSSKFFTAGSDTHFRCYDYEEKKMILDLSRNEFDLETTRGHSNRIYAIKCHPTDENIIFSGGWDNTIQMWDVRQHFPARSLYGAHISGDAIDVYNDLLLAGSWRTKDQFMLWDLRSFQHIATLQWTLLPEDQQCSIYAAKFCPNSNFVIGAGSGANQVKTFSIEDNAAAGSPLQLKSPVLSMCLDTTGDGSVIIGTEGGEISMYNFVT